MVQSTIDSFDGIVKNYLKAENLKDSKGSFVVEDVEIVEKVNDDGEVRNVIECKINIDDTDYVFALNFTNASFVKTKVKAPKDLIGKKLSYEKIKVQNPTTKKTVDGISLINVE